MNKLTCQWVCALSFIAGVQIGCAQSTVSTCNDFLSAIGEGQLGQHRVVAAPNPPGTRLVLTKGMSFVLSHDGGRILSFTNTALLDNIRLRRDRNGTSFCQSDAAFGQLAKNRVDAIHLGRIWNLRTVKSYIDHTSVSETRRARVYVDFEEKAFGVNTKGIGNFVQIVLDRQSGRVLEFGCDVTWSYLPPTVHLTESEARIKAKAVLAARSIAWPSNMVQTLGYTLAAGEFATSQASNLLTTKKVPFAYIYTSPKVVVCISASSGECVAGGRIKSSKVQS